MAIVAQDFPAWQYHVSLARSMHKSRARSEMFTPARLECHNDPPNDDREYLVECKVTSPQIPPAGKEIECRIDMSTGNDRRRRNRVDASRREFGARARHVEA